MTTHLKSWRYAFIVLLIGLLSCTTIKEAPYANKESSASDTEKVSALEAYVNQYDPAFHFDINEVIKGDDYTMYVVKMISQSWLDDSFVEDPIWWHWLTIVVPDEVLHDSAMLIIGGGNREDSQPKEPEPLALQTALSSKSIVASLHNIPNQPVRFIDDDFGPRYEDELIAYGWRKYLDGGAKPIDNPWLARFPMTKAAVRAMDVMTEVIKKQLDKKLDGFVVAGGSKRGWTTWTTAAVDKRVKAIVPIVIDMLNAIPSFEHHWRVYGYWAPAIQDYVNEGIMELQKTEEYKKLLETTEPYSFRERITIPKLLLNASGDQFFIPDSWRFYWNDLKGESLMRYVPNSEHSMADTDAIESMISFYKMILNNHARPEFDWTIEDQKFHIRTKSGSEPTSITLWQAANAKSRNFQVDSIGRAYKPIDIPLSISGEYTITIESPEQGFNASFVELAFPGLDDAPLKLSTGIVVTPDEYPFPGYD